MVLSSFFTIFKLKFSDYLQLDPKRTDAVTFCSFTGLFSKIISVTCYNFMVMTGEVQIKIDSGDDEPYQTSFIKFYSSMINTPFLGDFYNIILPIALIVFMLIFLLLNFCKWEKGLNNSLRRYFNNRDQAQLNGEHTSNG